MSWAKFYEYTHQEGRAIPHYLRAIYHTLTHWGTQILLSVVGVIGIAVFSAYDDLKKWLWIVCVVYILLEGGTILCHEYQRYAQKVQNKQQQSTKAEIAIRESLIESTCSLYNTASSGIYRNARTIMISGLTTPISSLREAFGFQTMAMQICHELYRVLHEHLGITNHTVTVYQRFDKTATNSVCKMIAYGNQYQRESLSYSKEYSIPTTCNDHTPYHSRIFCENSDEIRLLVDQTEVRSRFHLHKNCEEREKAIQQYIGIPMKARGQDIVFVLQVDSDVANCFGSDKETMRSLANAIIYPYASLLSMYYEMDRLLEIANSVDTRAAV